MQLQEKFLNFGLLCNDKMIDNHPFRPMRRFRQELPEEACLELLRTARRGVLSLAGDDGYPYGVPMNFYYAQGRIYFHCAREGHKIDAVRRCDKASFCVLSEPVRNPGEWWNCFTSVICFGRIREVTDGDERMALLRALGQKYFPEGYDLADDLRKNGPQAAVLAFSIEHLSGKRVREK